MKDERTAAELLQMLLTARAMDLLIQGKVPGEIVDHLESRYGLPYGAAFGIVVLALRDLAPELVAPYEPAIELAFGQSLDDLKVL
jgi:hypothetical protein